MSDTDEHPHLGNLDPAVNGRLVEFRLGALEGSTSGLQTARADHDASIAVLKSQLGEVRSDIKDTKSDISDLSKDTKHGFEQAHQEVVQLQLDTKENFLGLRSLILKVLGGGMVLMLGGAGSVIASLLHH